MKGAPPETTIRQYAESDAKDILALNAANVPEVGPMDEAKLEMFARIADWFPVVVRGGQVVGFAILLTEGAPYGSPNYGWFTARHPRFYYVDRIAVRDGERSSGIGGRIYGEALARARREDRPWLCAEVNTIPANVGSSRFHARFGFVEAGRLRPYGDDAEVAMLECWTTSTEPLSPST